MQSKLARQLLVSVVLASWIFSPVLAADANNWADVKNTVNTGGTANLKNTVTVDAPITQYQNGASIIGSGNIIEANGFQVLNNVSGLSGTITISDVTIQNAYGNAGQGGAIYNSMGNTLIIGGNVTFKNNQADGYYGGSAILNMGSGDVTIGNNVTFSDNFVKNLDGGFGGGGNAGALTNMGTGSIIIGDGVKFTGNGYTDASKTNIGSYTGGGIYNDAQLEIGDNSLFQGNAVTAGGGAIYNGGGYDKNGSVAGTLEIGSNAQFIDNISKQEGGAIYSQRFNETNTNTVTLGEGAVFKGNTAESYSGGAIAAYSTTVDVGAGAKFENNTAGGNGGAIYSDAYGFDASTSITNIKAGTTFSGNSAVDGGAIYNAAGKLTLDTTEVTLANGAKVSDIKFENNSASRRGADLYQGAGAETVITGDTGTVSMTEGIAGEGTITKQGQNTFDVAGDNSQYKGTYTQEQGTTIADGIFFGGTNNIEGGKFSVTENGSLIADVSVKDGVELDINRIIDKANTDFANGSIALDTSTGKILIESGAKADLSITGADNSDLNIASIGGTSDKIGSLDLGNGAGLSEDIEVNGTANLGLGDNVKTVAGKSITLNDSSTLELGNEAKPGSLSILNVNADIKGGTADTEIIKEDATLVTLSGNNGNYIGKYTQSSGTVNVADNSIFFGGESSVKGGVLALQDGSKLADGSGVNIIKDAVNGTYGTAIVYGETSNVDLNTGLVEFANTTGKINISNAGLTLANGYVYEGDATLRENSLTNGIADLGFANGAGVNGNITLEDNTILTYWDDAFIKDGGNITLNNNNYLAFRNENILDVNAAIKSNAGTKDSLLHKTGNGILNINKDMELFEGGAYVEEGTLNFNGKAVVTDNVEVDQNAVFRVMGDASIGGNLEAREAEILFNKDAKIKGSVIVSDGKADFLGDTQIGNLSSSGPVARLHGGNLIANNSIITIANKMYVQDNISLENAQANIYGNVTAGRNLDISNKLNMKNGVINTIDIGQRTTISGPLHLSIDAQGSDYTSDMIKTNNLVTNDNEIILDSISFNQYAPRDKNFNLQVLKYNSHDGNVNMIVRDKLIDTPIGQYQLMAGQGGMLSGSLVNFNPQVFRGQVATVASYANQLVVNNILFNHMQLVSHQMVGKEKTANKYAAIYPQFAPYQYSAKDGGLWYKAYGNFETISMTQGLNVHNNAYGSLIGADFPVREIGNGWKLIPTAYVGYNGAHQTFNGVGMYQNGGQVGVMGTAYKGDFITSLLAYGGGYYNSMNASGYNDATGNWFAGTASKSAYNIHLPADFIIQPTFLMSYNIFGQQNYHSNYGIIGMNSGYLNGINIAPGTNIIWNKETFSLYATAQLVFNIMGGVKGQAGNIELPSVAMRHVAYVEYGLGFTKRFKDRLNSYGQFTIRNGTRTGIGFQAGLQYRI